MAAYSISPDAALDLEEIWSYVSKENRAAALRVVESIHQRFPILARNPEIGTRRDELSANTRCLAVGAYVIYFRPLQNPAFTVEILRVLHGARDVSELF